MKTKNKLRQIELYFWASSSLNNVITLVTLPTTFFFTFFYRFFFCCKNVTSHNFFRIWMIFMGIKEGDILLFDPDHKKGKTPTRKRLHIIHCLSKFSGLSDWGLTWMSSPIWKVKIFSSMNHNILCKPHVFFSYLSSKPIIFNIFTALKLFSVLLKCF